MKLKHALFILILAIVVRFFAMTFKFYHWPGTYEMILVAQALLAIAVICIVYALATDKKVRGLLKGKSGFGVLLVLAGVLVRYIGVTFNILHWPGADQLLYASYAVMVAGFVCLLWGLGTNKKVQDFLKGK